MQDLSPEAIDHAEIMRLIREGGAFRATPALPAQNGGGAPGFQPAPAPAAMTVPDPATLRPIRADLPPRKPQTPASTPPRRPPRSTSTRSALRPARQAAPKPRP